MSLRADLDLAAMTRDDEGRWRAAAGMTTASTEETEVPNFDPATGMRNGVLLAVALIIAGGLVAWGLLS